MSRDIKVKLICAKNVDLCTSCTLLLSTQLNNDYLTEAK